MKLIKLQIKNPQFFIFTDNVEEVAPLFEASEGVIFISDRTLDSVDEFNLMRECFHFIIANSTYSWWAAFLAKNIDTRKVSSAYVAKNKGKIVLAPLHQHKPNLLEYLPEWLVVDY
jgi:hypothetical protein